MNRNITLARVLVALLVAVFGTGAAAQSAKTPREIALEFLRANPARFGLTPQDVADLKVTDEYKSKHNGLTHVWVQQQHLGIPVFNGLFGLHVTPASDVKTTGHRFVADLSKKANTSLPALSAPRALEQAMLALGFEGFKTPSVKQKINDRNWVFEAGAISKKDIPVSACYALDPKGKVRLAWTMLIEQANTSDLWNLRVDAVTGQVLDKINHTVYCRAGHAHTSGETCSDAQAIGNQKVAPTKQADKTAGTGAAESYRVFALPVESPAHGSQVLLTNPADPIGSPFGWHDTNGQTGPEYTYTRGNNVYAYEDADNNDTPPATPAPNPGASLTFDYPYDGNLEPVQNRNSAVTNLFYMNNMMHDITYRYGFDEAAGNFQANNYGNGGQGSDEVQAEAQDGGGQDNANFSTPPDGGNGRMQMYVWSRAGGKIVTVNAPGAVSGSYSAQATTDWGAPITNVPVTGDVVVTNDGSADPSLGCGEPVEDVTGKIVMVDRGQCQFGQKALNVERVGGIACIICNFEDATAGMAAGNFGNQVTIPVVMMKKNDCDLLRKYAGEGLNISIGLPSLAGPDFLDGDFDNGIIAHEYGHGISNRLTGGPSQAGCLANAEQMGEGWSDWFTLITTAKSGQNGSERRGVGTFVQRQDNDGQGIRRYPYSTDMGTSPITFSTVAENTQVHALGEVWAAMTWDLYWAMVEKYGFDPDWTNTNSGNGRAIQLVMDGMKLQPCSPGFQDGRDAIMLADIINYAGADTCLISSVFARRGLGYTASQGTSSNAADGIENFDPIPTCLKELKIKKVCTPTIDPGQDVQVTITLTNHKDAAATGVIVTDELPAGLTLKSASNGGTFSNGAVTWNLGSVASGQVLVLNYIAASDPTKGSLRFFRDEIESEDNWLTYSLEDNEPTAFILQSLVAKTGSSSFFGEMPPIVTDYVLETLQPIKVNGNEPVMRFWHQYDTEAGADAGFLEISKYDPAASQPSWKRLPTDKLIRGGYTGKVQYGTFAIPFLSGFSGNSNGWKQSYADLSEYIGQEIQVRFRAGTDDNTNETGWYVDDLEMMDILYYDTEACATSAQGDQACARAPEKGTITNPIGWLDSKEPLQSGLRLRVQPNPASDLLHISVSEDLTGDVRATLIGADGKAAKIQQQRGLSTGSVLQMDVQDLPAGMYFLRIEAANGIAVQKVTVH